MYTADCLIELQVITVELLSALQRLPAARKLHSRSGRTFFSELGRLNSVVTSDDFDLDRIKPLLNAALVDTPDDRLIWEQVSNAATEPTSPPRLIVSSLQQTPWRHKTSSFANSSEYRQDVDRVLKLELGSLYVGIHRFREAFFGGVPGLEAASKAVFEKCMESNNPLFSDGWSGWPKDANQDDVLSWFADLSKKLAAFAEDYMSPPAHSRRPLSQPTKPIQGSTAERKLDVGFVSDPEAKKDTRCHWSQILVPGELKSNPSADTASKAWLDLGRYAREVLTAQATRRFVLGFTICGSLMRIWEFDRLGGIASERFDINKDGLQFVSTILGFLWMNEEQLGFDPTIITNSGQQFIEIERNGQTERLIIDKLMKRAPCVSGRATTCWKAHRERDQRNPLVIKDSWQYAEREEEGELLREATDKDVINVARYYYHATVLVRGETDDIGGNVRGGLNIMTATNYRPENPAVLESTRAVDTPRRKGRTGSGSGLKRSSSQTGAFVPPSKRSCSASPTKADSSTLPNRVHRRVILRDYGKPIYKASTRSVLLAALEGCIAGHESLQKTGLLHRDISVNNLMVNEDKDNPSWSSFLIDLDLAIEEQREGASGAKGKTGTRAFMAIGVLLGEQHSFMHDLESFFWVLYWICIHYDGPNKSRVTDNFERWNYMDAEELAEIKKGRVSDERDFITSAGENFTPYYQPLIPWVNRLRKEVFPDGRRRVKPDGNLYLRMKTILCDAQKDSSV